jgi:short-subunit dehydrogenase
MYSASKFGLDGFGKSLQAELQDKNVYVTQIYPAYVQTNISKNAILGNGDLLGKTDDNIGKGIPVEEAVEDIMKAIYLKRYWVTIGSLYY